MRRCDLQEEPVEGGDIISSEAVANRRAVSLCRDQPGVFEGLKMRRGGGHLEAGCLRELDDAPWTLRQQLDQLQALAVPERLPVAGELLEQRWPQLLLTHNHLLHSSIALWNTTTMRLRRTHRSAKGGRA